MFRTGPHSRRGQKAPNPATPAAQPAWTVVVLGQGGPPDAFVYFLRPDLRVSRRPVRRACGIPSPVGLPASPSGLPRARRRSGGDVVCPAEELPGGAPLPLGRSPAGPG